MFDMLLRACSLQGYSSSELVSSGSEVIERTLSSTFLYLYLPKDTWTLLLKTESEGTTIETGWLVQPDLAIVTKCEIGSSGDLKVRRKFCDEFVLPNAWVVVGTSSSDAFLVLLQDVSLRVEKRISKKVAPVKVSAEELDELLTE